MTGTEKNKTGYKRHKVLRTIAFVAADFLLILAALFAAYFLRFEGAAAFDASLMPMYFLFTFPFYFAAMLLIKMYTIIWAYAGSRELLRLILFYALFGLISVCLNIITGAGLSTTVLICTAILSLAFCGGLRFAIRMIVMRHDSELKELGGSGERVMIVGAGAAGRFALGFFTRHFYTGKPVMFVDDDETKLGMMLSNVRVLGTTEDIPNLVEDYGISKIIVAIPTINKKDQKRILDICAKTKCQMQILYFAGNRNGDANLKLRNVDVADLLPREEINIDYTEIGQELKGKKVLVTGGGGSIGSEICRQILQFEPRKIIVFDIYENDAYALQCEMKEVYGPYVPLEIRIGSIRDIARVSSVMNEFRPDVVFNAAAHKHVPLMEDSPFEAIKNNVLGTKNVLECCGRYGVKTFVQISTDKAVNPVNVMGASKRITELMTRCMSRNIRTRCMITRFGNVLNSHGSVVPLMEKQIKNGGPVTVTHPDITRFFMTIPEAAQLVLQTMTFGKKGNIYVFDMGKSVKIMDMAEKLIRLSGLVPGKDIEIKISGLRPGEKLYEELSLIEENVDTIATEHARILEISQEELDCDDFRSRISEMIDFAEKEDVRALEIMAEFVPTLDVSNIRGGGD